MIKVLILEEVDLVAKIAVDQSLSNVSRFLQKKGYEVVTYKEGVQAVDAIVLSGGDENFMGIMDVETEVPIITANGLSEEEVYRNLQERLS